VNNKLTNVNYDLQLSSGIPADKIKFVEEKPPEEVYCRYCSKPILLTAVVCPFCGSQVQELKTTSGYQVAVKSKSVAVVMAVFLSFWSWLYTYGKSSVKFWISLILTIIVPITASGLINGSYNWLGFFAYPVVYLGAWIWAIADNATKSYKYFINYPNETK
jgi:hypothetical protein